MSVEPTQTHAADEPPTRTLPAPESGSTLTFSAADPGRTGSFSPHSGSEAPFPLPVIPGYDLLDVLGEGGMGRVYRARQHATDRIVALKVLLAGELASASLRERFRAEVTATAKLSHSHIVQVFEAGEAGGRAFLVCEYVPGGSLADTLDGTPWDATRAAKLIGPLARAASAAHGMGIVHRDLKPSNVLLALDGTPKLADFGIAKNLDSDSHTQTGAVLGTPSYMAPEQAGGSKAIGPAADVYGLGAILYELLTGRPPFRGKDFLETLDLVRTQEPVPPRVLQPKLPRDIETICLKCLQKDAAKRYSSAEALAEDLDRFLAGRPIEARPVGNAERAWRWCKRNRVVASLLASVVVVSVTGAVIAAIYAEEASEFARIANKNAGDAERREKEANDARGQVADLLDLTERQLHAAQVQQAYTASREYHTTRLGELLEAAKPQPGRADRRGWEWNYLDRLARSWESERPLDMNSPALASFDPQKETLWWTLSSDGKRALVRGRKMFNFTGMTRAGLFDAVTGRMIRDLTEQKDAIRQGTFTDAADPGMRFLAWSEAYRKPGEAPDAGRRWRVRLMNLDSGAIETPFPELEALPGLHVAPGGNRIVATRSGSRPAQFDLWERGRPGPMRVTWPAISPFLDIVLLGINPDTMTAVTRAKTRVEVAKGVQTEGNRLVIWDIPAPNGQQSGEPTVRSVCESITPQDQSILLFSAGGRTLLLQELQAVSPIRICDAGTGKRLGQYEPDRALPAGVWHVSDDGRRLVRRGLNESLVVVERIADASPDGGTALAVEWRTSVLRAPLKSGDGMYSGTLRLSGDGARLCVGSDWRSWEWDLTRTDFAMSWPERLLDDGETRHAIPARGGRWVLYQDLNAKSGRVGIYDVLARKMVRRFTVTGGGVQAGTLSVDGRRALFQHLNAPDKREWSLWASDESPRELAFGSGIAELSDDSRWVAERTTNAVRIHQTTDGKLAREIPVPQNTGTPVLRRWVAPNGTFVLLTYPLPRVSGEKQPDPVSMTLRFHDIGTGAVRGEWIMPVPWRTVSNRDGSGSDKWVVIPPEPCYSRDGSKLALANVADDGSVRAWVLDAATGKQVAEYAAAATPNSRLLAKDSFNPLSGQNAAGAFGAGEQLAMWSGRELVAWEGPRAAPLRLGGHTDAQGAVFSSDGRRVFTLDGHAFGSREQTVRAWDPLTGQELLTVRIPGEEHSGMYGAMLGEIWMENDRLHIGAMNGVRVFDGMPLK